MTDAAASVLSGSCDGMTLTPDELSFLKKESPAGLTLFGRNIDQGNHQDLLGLIAKIQSCSHLGLPPMLISIDQEGGRVARLKEPFVNQGPAMGLADGKSDQEATESLRNYGEGLGKSLLDLGINCNFAPVVDVLTEPKNEAIGDRCFGVNPSSVVIRAGAMLVGMNSAGILTCLKHFPGQGHADIDTHKGTAVVEIETELLQKREIFPFKSLQNNCPMIMVSHCVYSKLDSQVASMSKVIITDLLRNTLGYQGVVVTDDMTMGAVPSDPEEWKAAIVTSIAAGADLVLVCKGLDKWKSALDALRAEASRSKAFASRLSEAAARVTQMRQTIPEIC